MYELWSSPAVCAYSGEAEDLAGNPIHLPARVPGDSDTIITFFKQHRRDSTAFRWAARHLPDDAFIGAVGFNSLGSCCELAYHMIPRFWGNGFMQEACRAAINWALHQHGATTIEAYVEPRNERSVRLLQRLGLTATGDARHGAGRYRLDPNSGRFARPSPARPSAARDRPPPASG